MPLFLSRRGYSLRVKFFVALGELRVLSAFPTALHPFTASFFDELRDTKGIGTVEFADDTNLVAVGKNQATAAMRSKTAGTSAMHGRKSEVDYRI